jgi:hypothetical protein
MVRSIACAVLATLFAVGAASGASAPLPAGSPVPGTDPGHATPLELLASTIASHIANRQVSVRCESDANWSTVVSQAGGDPNGESGFVATQWNGTTGQLLSLSPMMELSSGICLPLQQFATATVKPTTCLPRSVPCYLGDGRTAAPQNAAYWARYESISIAILTLAHESIHLSGTVGGTLQNGLSVGDPQAEAKADCFGMQWMPYVAEQLGDTPADAQTVARYFWDKVYGLSRATHPQYWSADCRPGGALDERAAETTAWP